MVFESHQLSPYMITVDGYGHYLFSPFFPFFLFFIPLQLIPSKPGFGSKGVGIGSGRIRKGKEQKERAITVTVRRGSWATSSYSTRDEREDKRAYPPTTHTCSVLLTMFSQKSKGRLTRGYQKYMSTLTEGCIVKSSGEA